MTLDHISPEYLPGRICTDHPVDFWLRVTADGIHPVGCMDNGFHIYSPGSARWDATVPDTVGTLGQAQFDFGYWVISRDVDGIGADTVGFAGLATSALGIEHDFDTVAWRIRIGPISRRYDRSTICLDSCWYPPAAKRWNWAYIGDDNEVHKIRPAWGGPYCFQVVHPCCMIRGDIDHDGAGPDIADLVYVVTYMFQDGPEPSCMEEADINGDEAMYPDIADLVYLVTYMFQEGPPLLPCPSLCP